MNKKDIIKEYKLNTNIETYFRYEDSDGEYIDIENTNNLSGFKIITIEKEYGIYKDMKYNIVYLEKENNND